MDPKLEPRLARLVAEELDHLDSRLTQLAGLERYRVLVSTARMDGGFRSSDPFIQWLLEGYAFLAARVRLKLEDGFPRFTQNLLSVVCPPLAAPTPSMIIARFNVRKEKALLSGQSVERGHELRLFHEASASGKSVEIRFTTGRKLDLYPLEVTDVRYLPDQASLEDAGASAMSQSDQTFPAGISVTLSLGMDASLQDLQADHVDLYVTGTGDTAGSLFEAIGLCDIQAEILGATGPRGRVGPPTWIEVSPLGFEGERYVHHADRNAYELEFDKLLPYDTRNFEGHRLLHEFFALPQRFHFIRLSGLRKALKGRTGPGLTMIFHLPRRFPDLASMLRPNSLLTNCVPAVNLFEHNAGVNSPDLRQVEHEVLLDMGDPTSYEIHTVTKVIGRRNTGDVIFLPFFSQMGLGGHLGGKMRYYALSREARLAPVNSENANPDMTDRYRGSEVKISLIDDTTPPMPRDLKQLDVHALCTNRHLPGLLSGVAGRAGRLQPSSELGTESIVIQEGPSQPRPALPDGRELIAVAPKRKSEQDRGSQDSILRDRRLWHAINLLSLNYLSLTEVDGEDRVAPLRQLMGLFIPEGQSEGRDIAEALTGIDVSQVPRRITPDQRNPSDRLAPVTFARGLKIELTMAEHPASGATLAAILSNFFAGYVSVNTFTETVLHSPARQERLKWRPRSGNRTRL